MERILSITSKISEGLASALGRSPQARSNARMQDPGTTVATDVHGNVARIPKNSVSKDEYGHGDQYIAPPLLTVDSGKQCSSQLGRDGQPCKRQRMEEHSTQGVCHRRVDAGAISSQAMPHFRAHSSVPDKRGSNGKSFLFPERTDKSAQVTPSLRDKAWANKEKARSRAQKSVQQSLPPPDSQYDLANLPNSKSIVPKRWPRGSKRSTTDLVTCMQNTRISGQPTQEVDDNDIEVLEHTGPSPISDERPLAQAWHQHTHRYQELDKKWAQEEKRIEAQDAYNRKLASAHAQVRALKMRSDESMLKAEVDTSKLSFADRRVQQAQAHRQAMCAKSPYLAERMQLEQSILHTSAALRSEPPSAEKIDLQDDDDEVVVLTDSDGEQPDNPVTEQDDGGAVDLLSDSDESVASESEAEEEEDSVFPNGEALSLDVPERVICGRLCAAYEQLVMKLRQYDTVVSHDRAHVGITGEEFHTMAPRAWLGDACINMYIALLQDRDKEWHFKGADKKRPRCLFMNSHFVTKLCQEAGGYDYSKVSRWTAARKRKALAIEYYSGIEDLDKLVLPVHLGNHWTCAVLNFKEQRIEYYDSLKGVDSTTINSLLRWVEDEYADKYSEDLPERFQTKNWTKVFNPEGTPQQMNGHDCGVFAMMCCNYVSADRDFDYSQDEVHSFFRKMCCLECYCKRLRSIDL